MLFCRRNSSSFCRNAIILSLMREGSIQTWIPSLGSMIKSKIHMKLSSKRTLSLELILKKGKLLVWSR